MQLRDRFYGKYRGIVVRNDDPEKRGRIKALVPDVLGDIETPWCECSNVVNRETLFIPEIGDKVWIEFQGGNVNLPIYSMAWFGLVNGQSTIVDEGKANYPNVRVMGFDKDVSIVYDKVQGSLVFKIGGNIKIELRSDSVVVDNSLNKMELKNDGSVDISGSVVNIQANQVNFV